MVWVNPGPATIKQRRDGGFNSMYRLDHKNWVGYNVALCFVLHNTLYGCTVLRHPHAIQQAAKTIVEH